MSCLRRNQPPRVGRLALTRGRRMNQIDPYSQTIIFAILASALLYACWLVLKRSARLMTTRRVTIIGGVAVTLALAVTAVLALQRTVFSYATLRTPLSPTPGVLAPAADAKPDTPEERAQKALTAINGALNEALGISPDDPTFTPTTAHTTAPTTGGPGGSGGTGGGTGGVGGTPSPTPPPTSPPPTTTPSPTTPPPTSPPPTQPPPTSPPPTTPPPTTDPPPTSPPPTTQSRSVEL